MEANHTLRNAFPSDLDFPKSFFFPRPQSWLGLGQPLNHGIFILQGPYLYCHSPWKIWKPCRGARMLTGSLPEDSHPKTSHIVKLARYLTTDQPLIALLLWTGAWCWSQSLNDFLQSEQFWEKCACPVFSVYEQ